MKATNRKYVLITLGEPRLKGILNQGGITPQPTNSFSDYKPLKVGELIKKGVFVS